MKIPVEVITVKSTLL